MVILEAILGLTRGLLRRLSTNFLNQGIPKELLRGYL